MTKRGGAELLMPTERRRHDNKIAMTALNLEALGPNVRTDVSLALLSKLRDGQVYDEAGRFVLADGRVERQ